jgi:hypothetical protein
LIGDTMSFDEDHVSEAAGLERFHAFIHAEGYDRPGLIRVMNPRTAEDSSLPDTDAIRERFNSIRTESREFDQSVIPYSACTGCQSACQHRAWAHASTARRVVQRTFWNLVSRVSTDPKLTFAQIDELVRDIGESEDPDRLRCVLVHLSMAAFDSNHEQFVQQAMSRISTSTATDPVTAVSTA